MKLFVLSFDFHSFLKKHIPDVIPISTFVHFSLVVISLKHRANRGSIATIGDKMSWDTSPKTGLFYVLLTSKGGNIAFLPHPLRAMLCPCSSYL